MGIIMNILNSYITPAIIMVIFIIALGLYGKTLK